MRLIPTHLPDWSAVDAALAGPTWSKGSTAFHPSRVQGRQVPRRGRQVPSMARRAIFTAAGAVVSAWFLVSPVMAHFKF